MVRVNKCVEIGVGYFLQVVLFVLLQICFCFVRRKVYVVLIIIWYVVVDDICLGIKWIIGNIGVIGIFYESRWNLSYCVIIIYFQI